MIAQELILLGLIKESPQHGYQIKRKIKEIFALFAGIDLKSIYYPLGVLEKKGLVARHIDQEGRRPQRLVYALTHKGETRFQELLKKSFLNFKRPQFSLDLSLYFLNYIKPKIAKRRLQARIFILNKLSKDLNQMIRSFEKKKPYSLVSILKHNLQMLEAESKFLTHLIKRLSS